MCREASPCPFPVLSLTPYLLGLGRGLRREAGAGTFRDPAVSVMRAHQLERQDKTRGISAPKPHPVRDTPSHHPWRLSLFAFRRCLCHQLIYLGLLVPGKNDVESFVICIERGEMCGARAPSVAPSGALSPHVIQFTLTVLLILRSSFTALITSGPRAQAAFTWRAPPYSISGPSTTSQQCLQNSLPWLLPYAPSTYNS